MSNNQKEVKIRMYRQGLGDCFLLTFPRDPEPYHLLIDCGAINSKHYDTKLMKAVVGDIQQATGGKLDAIAGTHEHWDHISGFLQAKELFDQMKVKKVWVAWTEDENSEAAKQIKSEFKKQKKAVEMALQRLPDAKINKHLGLYKSVITDLFGFYGGLGAKAGSKGRTEEAWDCLLGYGQNVYCYPTKKPLTLEGVAGVRVYVLGPPDDPAYIRRLLSKKETYDEGKQSLTAFDSFRAAVEGEAASPELSARAFPFEEQYRIPPKQARKRRFFRDHYGFSKNAANEWRRIDDSWLSVAGELALHLDNYTNNACLALAIELVESGKVLLFPGDAQVGNWLSWEGLSWKVKNAEGETQTVKIDDLLARTVLYKVGHHGSHNATLRAKGLERMESSELVAMIPVHRKTAEDQAWEFPYPPLWKRLKERANGRVLLADAKGLDEIKQEARKRLSADEWDSFQACVTCTDLYVEYRIAL